MSSGKTRKGSCWTTLKNLSRERDFRGRVHLPCLQAQGLRELREMHLLQLPQVRVHAEARFFGIEEGRRGQIPTVLSTLRDRSRCKLRIPMSWGGLLD